jgi:catechol 2,3-dioxygenase-like lactoylglutathione lyase family enzyme
MARDKESDIATERACSRRMFGRQGVRPAIFFFILIALELLAGGGWRSQRASTPGANSFPFAIDGIAEVKLRSDAFAATRRFYKQVLGYDEVFDLRGPGGVVKTSVFKVNDRQYIEISHGQNQPEEDLQLRIAFQTTNAAALRQYLAHRKTPDLGRVHRTPAGNLGFTVRDPEGHPIEFVQYAPGSLMGGYFGKDMPSRRISTKIIHAGFIVQNRGDEDQFFRDDLRFHLMWYGGMTDQTIDWVDMRVPGGANWIEYMLRVRSPSLHALGVMYHFSLGVPSVAEAYKVGVERGYRGAKPQIGRDGKWQLNFYDPDGTRVELMEPKPVRTPCCSPMRLGG